MKYQLKSTGEFVWSVEWIAMTPCPWDTTKYERVLMPNGAVQVIRREKLMKVETEYVLSK